MLVAFLVGEVLVNCVADISPFALAAGCKPAKLLVHKQAVAWKTAVEQTNGL